MALSQEYIEELVYKFNTGTVSKDELNTLLDWYNSHEDEQVTILTKNNDSRNEVKARMLTGLMAKISDTKAAPIKRKLDFRWVASAAAILVIAFGIWFTLDRTAPAEEEITVQSTIAPGGNKATLTLADGRTIALSSKQEGIVTGSEITYTNGVPIATADQTDDATRLLALHTPRGGTYKITLSDGTEVWLNAASTIKYPSRFDADARTIELAGEAYFQVKPLYRNGNKVPFRVVCKKQEIEVLGTHFNISAYPDQATKTTLVEGKVAVDDHNKRFVLAPNDQSATSDGKTRVKKVDVNIYTAWRDGKFNFDDKTFEETMGEIGRWYDLDIVYENGIPNADLVGDAFRNQNFGLVLRLLDVAEIDYKLDVANRVLTIKKKKYIKPKP